MRVMLGWKGGLPSNKILLDFILSTHNNPSECGWFDSPHKCGFVSAPQKDSQSTWNWYQPHPKVKVWHSSTNYSNLLSYPYNGTLKLKAEKCVITR